MFSKFYICIEICLKIINLPLDLKGRFFIQMALCLCCSNEGGVGLSKQGNTTPPGTWDGTILFELP